MTEQDNTSLYLLAVHAMGDFPLQTDWMAQRKFKSRSVRLIHVLTYTACFIPILKKMGWSTRQKLQFLLYIAVSHFTIDSRRWNDEVPIWYDQALHLIALTVSVELANND